MVFCRLGSGKPALLQEFVAVLVRARDDLLLGGLDAGDEGRRRGIGETGQGWRGFVREARRGVFGVPNGDLLKVLDAPQVAIHGNRAQVERGDAERLRADL
jgi:hypothetical protein